MPLYLQSMLGVKEDVIKGGVGIMPPSFFLCCFVNPSSHPKLFLGGDVRVLDIRRLLKTNLV